MGQDTREKRFRQKNAVNYIAGMKIIGRDQEQSA